MRKGYLSALIVIMLLTGCSLYDPPSDEPEASQTDQRYEDVPLAPVGILSDEEYETEEVFHGTTTVQREQMSDIPANTPYGDILEKLGKTEGFSQPWYRQYLTEDNRVIPLCFHDKSDLCPYSGEELYNRALPLDYDGEIPDGMIYGVITSGGDFPGLLFIHYMQYVTDEGKLDIYKDRNGERSIEPDFIATSEAEIVFEDGAPATEDDLKPETPVLIKRGISYESYPGRMDCLKIVILK